MTDVENADVNVEILPSKMKLLYLYHSHSSTTKSHSARLREKIIASLHGASLGQGEARRA
jgi:hypothetical protein